MNRDEAHRLLSAAQLGADVPTPTITQCLRATGDLDGRYPFGLEESSNPVAAMHVRLLRTARAILAGRGHSNVSEEFAFEWAETMLRQNPTRLTQCEPYALTEEMT